MLVHIAQQIDYFQRDDVDNAFKLDIHVALSYLTFKPREIAYNTHAIARINGLETAPSVHKRLCVLF